MLVLFRIYFVSLTYFKKTLMAFAMACSFATAAEAVPVNFRFQMPLFDAFDLSGQASTLTITADNGSSLFANQNYLNTQFSAYTVEVNDLVANVSLPDFSLFTDGSQIYIATDEFGIPTLDLTLDLDSSATIRETPNGLGVQLGTRRFSGPIPYAVDFGIGPNSPIGAVQDGFVVVGERVVTQVPLPAGLGFLVFGILTLFAVGSRRA